MGNRFSKRKFLWGLLGLAYTPYAFGEKEFDLEEKETNSQTELVSTESSIIPIVMDERDEQSARTHSDEPQEGYFLQSENLNDHLVSSGGTPFSQFENLHVVNLPLDAKLKENREKQKKELLDRLIAEYLERFSNTDSALKLSDFKR